MICSEFFALLDNYESITDEQRAEMEKHTAECETCRKELEFFKSVMCNLASIPTPEAPKTLIDKVNAKLDAEKPVVVGFKWNFRVLSTVAACLAIGLAVGINNGYIKDAITGNGTDGIINETVVTTEADKAQQSDEKSEVETSVVEPEEFSDEVVTPKEKPTTEPKKVDEPKEESKKDIPKTQTSGVSDQGNSTKAPASGSNKPAVETPKVTVAPKPTQTPVVTPEPVIKSQPTATQSTTATQTPVVTSEPAVPTPDVETPVATPAPTPNADRNVDDYAMKEGSAQIAYGRYNVETARTTTNEFSDYLHVQSNDMGTVVSTMSEMGVKNSGGYYMTSRQNFYALMDTLNDKGVGYECDLQYNSGDKISFRLTYN